MATVKMKLTRAERKAGVDLRDMINGSKPKPKRESYKSANAANKAARTQTARNEYSVYFERTVTMTYSTEVWAKSEAEAIELAKKEADDNPWVEGDLVDEKKPIIRSVRGNS